MFCLIFFSFLFGITTKLADLFNEHGVKEPFRGAALLSGILWGVVGAALIYFNPPLRLFYTALMFYWILQNKLEYKNHAIGGIIVILASLKVNSHFFISDVLKITFVIIAYEATRYLYSNSTNKILKKIIGYRLYYIPFIYSYLMDDYSVFIASVLAVFGVRVINKLVCSYMINKNLVN